MYIKRKMLLMAIYSQLVKDRCYYSARNLLQTLLGLQDSFDKSDFDFWAAHYGFIPEEWYYG